MKVEIIGHKIKAIRPMSKAEKDAEGWNRGAAILELDNGVKLYASRDEEGNGPGVLFGSNGQEQFVL